MKFTRLILTALIALGAFASFSTPVHAGSAWELDQDARQALQKLFAEHPKTRQIAAQASAILVFPKIIKAGFIFGAQGGEGVLMSNSEPLEYYRTSSVSYGLQAGVQKFGYVLFFMNRQALSYLEQSNGWEIGVGPSIVIIDEGAARNMTTTTLQKDIYAVIFNQKGLMAGIGLQGTKVTPFTPDYD